MLILLSVVILFISVLFWLVKEWEKEAYLPCWCGSTNTGIAWVCSDEVDYKDNAPSEDCPDSFENK